MPKPIEKIEKPRGLAPYTFHGVDIDAPANGGKQANGECPFCGKRKFGVNVETKSWNCFACGRGGGPPQFAKELYDFADITDTALADLAADRGVKAATLKVWGVKMHPMGGDPIVPAYDGRGDFHQLYKYGLAKGRRTLMATPGMWPEGKAHGLFLPPGGFDEAKPDVFVCEGPWDAMALWEAMGAAKRGEDGSLALTGNPATSLRASANVVAVPGASSWQDSWGDRLRGKNVTLLYDSDYPHEHPLNSGRFIQAGFDGIKRVAGKIVGANVAYLNWGPNGYDPKAKSGFDVRDLLTEGGGGTAERVERLGELFGMVTPVPAEWPGGVARPSTRPEIDPEDCRDWKTVLGAWQNAMLWRRSLEEALAVCFAVCMSTSRAGDQLFLQMIGDAGSGKTRFCDGLLVSKNCHALEHLTGFHSGFKDGSGKDFSLLTRINHKTLITPEGDVLMSSPHFTEIMSQQRRIFDGTSGATYKNQAEDTRYTGLRTPWIIAGTPALMDTDQSRLGDRFIRIVIDPPSEDDKNTILRFVANAAFDAVRMESNCSPASSLAGDMLRAYRLTGGYVDYLRANAERLIAEVDARVDREWVGGKCAMMAELTADLRARPHADGATKIDVNDSKELPTRLTHQFVRLACCLAAVRNKKTVDDETLRTVRKVAMDTARGRTQDIARVLATKEGGAGMNLSAACIHVGENSTKMKKLLIYLAKIGVVQPFEAVPRVKGFKAETRYRLTPRVAALYAVAVGDA